MRNNKFSFTGETIEISTTPGGRITLNRIKAECDLPTLNIKGGDLGGFIQYNENLGVSGDAWVYGNAQISGNAQIYGDAGVSGDAQIYGDAGVSGDAWVYGNAQISGNAKVSGNAQIYGNAKVSGDAWVYGDAKVSGDAWVFKTKDYLVIGPLGSDRYITFTFSDQMVVAGCFRGTLAQFTEKVDQKYGSESDYYTAIKYLYLIIENF